MRIPKILTNKVNRLIVKIPVGIVKIQNSTIAIVPILNFVITFFLSMSVKGFGLNCKV